MQVCLHFLSLCPVCVCEVVHCHRISVKKKTVCICMYVHKYIYRLLVKVGL